MDLPVYPFVLIRWRDAYGCSSIWYSIKEAIEPPPHECLSVGWKVKETDEVVVIVPHLSVAHKDIGAEEQGCGDMTIPKSVIVSTDILSIGKPHDE